MAFRDDYILRIIEQVADFLAGARRSHGYRHDAADAKDQDVRVTIARVPDLQRRGSEESAEPAEITITI